MPRVRSIDLALGAAVILTAFFSLLPAGGAMGGAAGGVVGSACAYILIMLVPGAAFYLLLARRPQQLDLLLYSLLASPVLAASACAVLMLLGMNSQNTARILLLSATALALLGLFLKRRLDPSTSLSAKQWLILLGIIAAFCFVAGYLPLAREWWRVRSDAWFHAAIVAQIDSYGLPPEDPYFAGLTLQYMWLYHVLIFIIAKTSHLRAFMVMPIINLQVLAGFIVATYLFSVRLRNGRQRFAMGISSVLVAVLGLNALFWLFLPLKLVRLFIGEVRGTEELVRTFSLSPFNMLTVRHFLRIYHNQVFFLDKFIVSTAFSLGLAYMAAFWYSISASLTGKNRPALAMLVISTIGMLAFHTAVGFIMLAGLFGALFFLYLERKDLANYSSSSQAFLGLAAFAGFVVTIPYLYSVMHLKEAANVFPLSISFAKFVGFFISCALVIWLAAFQARKLYSDRIVQGHFVIAATLVITVLCLIIKLPGPNTFDKLPFFIFYPLAVVGGWTLIEWSRRRQPGVKGQLMSALMFILLLVPANLLATLGYYHTPSRMVTTPSEKLVAAWVKSNTSRDAIFIDSGDRVFLLVTGPRRYYWGTAIYADFWGYSKEEMRKRRHVRDNLYSSDDIDKETLESLSTIKSDVYIIARGRGEGAASQSGEKSEISAGGITRFSRYPDLFHMVFSAGSVGVFKVDKAACLRSLMTPRRTKTGN